MSLRVAATRRFVSAAGDDIRKDEMVMAAQPRRSLLVCADSTVSIARAAIRHRRSFRGRARGAREYKPTDYFIFSRKIFSAVRHIV